MQIAAEWALSRVPAQSATAHGWSERWAPMLGELQMARWLILALSLAGAVWLMMGTGSAQGRAPAAAAPASLG